MKSKFLKATFLSLFLSMFCLVKVANAGLINVDYISSGDGLSVYDSTTGLTWLDLSVTAPFNSLASVETQFSGYTTATSAQLITLFAGFSDTVADMNRWYGLFGHSELNGPLSECSWQIACSYGKSSEGYIVGYGINNASVGYFGSENYSSDNYVAYIMVKDGDNVSVPEPTTLAIFALGIMGLASRRFKKQS